LATKELSLASRQRTVSHLLLHHKMFDKNNLTYFSLFPRLKIKLKASVLTQLK
jgi:hypothetical protein